MKQKPKNVLSHSLKILSLNCLGFFFIFVFLFVLLLRSGNYMASIFISDSIRGV